MKTPPPANTSVVVPKTRTEHFLAKIAGDPNAKELTPRTRIEYFLNEIAENGGSGDGDTKKSIIADKQTVTPESGDKSTSEFYNRIIIIPNENFDQTNLPNQIELVVDGESILLMYVEIDGEFWWEDEFGSIRAAVEDDNIVIYYSTIDGYDDKAHTVTVYEVEATPPNLPFVTSSDDGSVLTVVNGGWDKVALPDERTKELFYGVNFFRGIPTVSWRPISVDLGTVKHLTTQLPVYYYAKLFEKIGYVFFTNSLANLSNAANNGPLMLIPKEQVFVPLYVDEGSSNLGKLAGYIYIAAQTGVWTVTKTDSDITLGTSVNGFCLFPLA